ncbi:MAG: hypothetical protein GXP30_10555 [Verrucomicrobia bacterium]|nr:hypothetical protein [Verrucomicrobiota bacterium]
MLSADTNAPIVIKGIGAVSPAGWSANTLVAQTLSDQPLPHEERTREGNNHPAKVRPVPKPDAPQDFARHPRLRRVSAISRFVTAAGIEALGQRRAEAVRQNKLRLGIVVVFATGCVAYTGRFFQEVLDNPKLASPILFPETVFNAPASHLAAILSCTGINYTLLGDAAEYLSGLRLASDWLTTHQCDGCLVIGAEEIDWLISEAVQLFTRDAILSEGAGALYLEMDEDGTSNAPRISCITDPVLYTHDMDRNLAAKKMRAQLELAAEVEKHSLLLDGLQSSKTLDKAENNAWGNWSGQRLSIRKTLGDALGASVAWQCVAAAAQLKSNTPQYQSTLISAVGLNQQSIAAKFIPPIST